MHSPIALIGGWLARLRDRRRQFRHELAVCAIFKNEAPYIAEWLTFHEGVGVSHFYLYNDASDDNFEDVIAPWVSRGMVTVTDWPTHPQVVAYNDCIRRFRMDARWIAFIDLDEFLFSPGDRPLPEVLEAYRGVAALFVYWVLFGSGGNQERPDGSVLEAYRHCLDLAGTRVDNFDHGKTDDRSNYVTGWSRDGKSIVNPRLVRRHSVHKPKSVWAGSVMDENGLPVRQRQIDAPVSYSKFRINHYWSRSIEELTFKVDRGDIADRTRPKRSLERWLEREKMLNDSIDETVIPIWRRIYAEAGQRRNGSP
jgi:hypothetical protein